MRPPRRTDDMTEPAPFHLMALGTSGLDLLEGPLRRALVDGGFTAPSVAVGGYDAWREALFAPPHEGLVADVILVVLDGDDLLTPFLDDLVRHPREAAAGVGHIASDIVAALDQGLANHPASQFLVTTVARPAGSMLGSATTTTHQAWADALDSLNRSLAAWASGQWRAHLLDLQELIDQHGRRTLRDARLWALARCRWSGEGLGIIARRVVSTIRAIHGRSGKCLVLDLDNTLWGGVVGEDGPSGIALGTTESASRTASSRCVSGGSRRRAFCWQSQAGTTRPRHGRSSRTTRPWCFAATTSSPPASTGRTRPTTSARSPANSTSAWTPWSFWTTIPRSDSVCAVPCPRWLSPIGPRRSTDLATWADELAWTHFDRLRLDAEDLGKTARYHARSKQEALRTTCTSLEEWLSSLGMRSRCVSPGAAVLPRFAQLAQKTNQFNVTSRRYTESQMADRAADPAWVVLGLDLVDCFGDNGIVALAMAEDVGDRVWRVDNFLMSCRVIGRTLERTLLCLLVERAIERGGRVLRAEFIPSGRNGLVESLWKELGFSMLGTSTTSCDGHTTWSLDLTGPAVQPSPYIELDPQTLRERKTACP